MTLKRFFLNFKQAFKPTDDIDKERNQIEDILKALYHSENSKTPIDISTLCEVAQISEEELPRFLDLMTREELITKEEYQLTEVGKKRALAIIRRHRLYETFLSEHSGYSAGAWHRLADSKEHTLTDAEEEKLNSMLGNPLFDPHGDPIPTAENLQMPKEAQTKKTEELTAGKWFIVEHIEDDNDAKYQALIKLHLVKDMVFRIDQINTIYIIACCMGQRIKVRRDLLSALDLREATPKELERSGGDRVFPLSALGNNEIATIHTISPECKGSARRRLMDLGFVQGSDVLIDVRSPMGNPTAYIVRGSAIALREDQADFILIKNRRSLAPNQ